MSQNNSHIIEHLENRTLFATVTASVETTPVPHSGDSADDIAIWVHPTNPSLSTVIGTDKASGGGIAVYNLQGQQLSYFANGATNNIDVRYGFQLGNETIDLVAASRRVSGGSLSLFKVNPNTRALENIAARTLSTGLDGGVYGVALYKSPTSGKFYAFLSSRSDGGNIEQWELFDNGAGKIDGKIVRTFDVGSTTEAMVADDDKGFLYVGEEQEGIWRYSAEPNAGTSRVAIDTTGGSGHLTADVEGLAVYEMANGAGYLLCSSQGADEYTVYNRNTGAYLGTFDIGSGTVDAVTDSDGIEVLSLGLGNGFSQGIFVTQDGSNSGNQNFKFIPWERIANGLSLQIDTSQNPRGGSIPNPPQQNIILSTNNLVIPEGSNRTVNVSLATQPSNNVIININRQNGDSDLISQFSTLTFTTQNWNQAQSVQINANEDIDTIDGNAVFAFASSGLTTQTLSATEDDNDTNNPPPPQGYIRINFQPSNAPIPTGYLVDSGLVFGDRGDYNYGWNQVNTGSTRDRNSANSVDQRFDTLNHMQQGGNKQWEIELPNGTYAVRLVAGDPNHTDSVFRINAEGQSIISGTPTTSQRWFDNTINVVVNDGRLTLSNGAGSSNNKINFIEITNVDTNPPPVTPNIVLSSNQITVAEGDSNSVSVRLDNQPSNNITVNINKQNGDGNLTTTSSSVTFTPQNWNQPQVITFNASEDSDTTNGTASFTFASPNLTSKTLTVVEDDNDLPETPTEETIRVDFLPAGSTVPTGYLPDTGLVFGNRGNYSYGWNQSNPNARDRGVLTDQRLDTINHMQNYGTRTWEIGLPNGSYNVKLVAGDPSYFNSIYRINVEGVLAVNGTPTSTNRFIEGNVTVNVTDGKLTVSNASGSSNNKVAFIEITPAGNNPNPNPNPNPDPDPQPASKPGPNNTGPTSNPSNFANIGNMDITQDGFVLENVNITGRIFVYAKNVIIRNFTLNTSGSYGIKVFEGGSALIEDGELSGTSASGALLTGWDFTARNLEIHNSGTDGINPRNNNVIENCWIHHLGLNTSAHADAIQLTHGNNMIFRNNFFDIPKDIPGTKSNAAVFLKEDSGPISNITIENNWLNGGNYTIYARGVDGLKVINNRFGRDYQYGIRSIDTIEQWNGNVWDDSGEVAS